MAKLFPTNLASFWAGLQRPARWRSLLGAAPDPLRPRVATRLACLGLFALSITLAGAASKAVQGMAESDGFEPVIIDYRPANLDYYSNRAPEDFMVVMTELDDPPPPPRRPSEQPPPRPKPILPAKPPAPSGSASTAPAQAKSKQVGPPAPAPRPQAKTKAETKPARELVLPPAPKPDAKVIPIRDRSGRRVIARIYGTTEDRVAVLLPDGQIGFADGMVTSDAPFVPATMDQMRDELLKSDYQGFKVCQTKHYLVFYNGTEKFALASANVLEDLYDKLSQALLKRGFAVHESEFPLVAVIYAKEEEFRARKKVANEVQAYYEILSNRIFMYESSKRDQGAPEMALLRKPQTVAHEGSHQILQNIGVQPRLADWPLWLVEGFAEYCSPPKMGKSGVTWAGLNQINPLHMVTIRDLQDPASSSIQGEHIQPIRLDPRDSWIRTLVSKRELTPTDYALSWALTHYLANKQLPEFLEYLKEMSQRPPLERRTGEEHLADFQRAFGKNLSKLDSTVSTYLSKIKKFDALPYYLVMFEQSFASGVTRRSTMVSQSPSMIYQWIDGASNPRGNLPRWQVVPYPTRARAILSAQDWIQGPH